jgi:hypothetical protein
MALLKNLRISTYYASLSTGAQCAGSINIKKEARCNGELLLDSISSAEDIIFQHISALREQQPDVRQAHGTASS